VQQGEAFDVAVKNLEARTRRATLANGAKLLLLPKKTRAQTVKLVMELRLGTADSLKGQQAVSSLTAALVGRGTQALPYKEFRTRLEQLKSNIAVGGRGQTVSVFVTTQRPQLDEVLGLLRDTLLTPALDGKELEVLRGEVASRLDGRKGDPTALGSLELSRALTPLPDDHVYAVLPIADQLAQARAVTLEQVKAFYARFYGVQAGAISVVGDFDDVAVEKQLGAAFGTWSSKEKFEPAPDPFVASKPEVRTVATPDKPNAWIGSGTTVQLVDTAPDYPAMLLASRVLGGGASARLFAVLREKQGLSYGAYAGLRVDDLNDRAVLMSNVTFAPQNLAAVEKGLQGELERWPTITKDELESMRKEVLDGRLQARASDDSLAGDLARLATQGRTMAWEGALDDALKAVTPEQANAAVKKYVDLSRLVVVKAGDFKVVAAPK
jgi:zinc protease